MTPTEQIEEAARAWLEDPSDAARCYYVDCIAGRWHVEAIATHPEWRQHGEGFGPDILTAIAEAIGVQTDDDARRRQQAAHSYDGGNSP